MRATRSPAASAPIRPARCSCPAARRRTRWRSRAWQPAGASLVGASEHDAVRAAAPGATAIPVLGDGTADIDALARELRHGPALVCLMAANNETGVIHPIARVAALCRDHGALLHVDGVQAAGRLAAGRQEEQQGIGLADGADSLAISAHKLGGPAGIGALLLSPAADGVLRPQMTGGGQERGRRGGTPAVPLAAGFAAAATCPATDLSGLRDRAEQAAIALGAIVAGGDALRLGNTTCIAMPGTSAQTQLIALDLAGIAVSAGAACSSGKVARSHVLAAMGWGDLAGEAIRVSLPWSATVADIDAFIAAYTRLARRRRAA